ncbi:MAG: glycosyltransferase [Anaerolineae bacterium]|nr:glycosyltransferase [Anaerolineae bacterium]
MSLSVVLITRNQAWNIARLVESVLAQESVAALLDVVVVDSASSDATVAIASRYPIDVIALHADQRLTAAAGRYVGYRHTAGEFVLFLDGDMTLIGGWLDAALVVLRAQPDVAAVTGDLIERPTATPPDADLTVVQPADPVRALNIPQGGGAALYRRSVLEEVGTFHPYIISDEEPELCVRIRQHGYRVVKLNRFIAYHFSDPEDALGTLIRRARRRLYFGAGQNLRLHLGDAYFLPYLKERGFGLIPLAAVIAGLALLVWGLLSGYWALFGLWLLALLGVVALDTLRKRSLYRALYSLLLRVLIMDGTLRGFLLTPLDPATTPVRFDVVHHGQGDGAGE